MFNNKKSKKESKKGKFWLYLILGGILIEILKRFKKSGEYKDLKSNFGDFLSKESKEVSELASGEESVEEFIEDSGNIFKNYFIPHSGNGHKPKFLRPRSLVTIAIFALILKMSLVGYLFIIFPDHAKMTELISAKIFELTNRDRIENSLQALSINKVLNASAFAKANDMLVNDYFAHTSPDGKKPWDWIDRSNYPYLYVGENLAMNFTTADSAHKALMNSLSHKKNILSDRYSEIGIAMSSGELNGENTSVLVELFAMRKVVQPALAKTDQISQSVETGEEIGIPAEQEDQTAVKETKDQIVKELPKVSITDITEPDAQGEIAVLPQEFEPVIDEALISPNIALEQDQVVEIKSFSNIEDRQVTLASRFLSIVKLIMLVVLAIVTISLIINIFVRIKIQHKPVIIQSLLLVIFISGLLYFNIHFLEAGFPDILIL